MLKTTSAQYGFNIHATAFAPHLYTDLGAQIARIDYQGVPFRTIQNNVSVYSGMRRLLLVHSFEAALEARSLGNAVEVEYENEIGDSNQDPTDPVQYVHELRMLAAYGVHPWAGCVSSLRDPASFLALVDAGLLKVAKRIAVHLYGDQPEELLARIQWLRTVVGDLPIFVTEYGPGKAVPPKELADFMARTIKVVPSLGVPLILYRGPEERRNPGSGIIDADSGQPVAAYGLLKQALAPVAN